MPLIPSLILGGLCATVFGILFGLPSLRVKGLYLAVATLAAQFFTDWMFLRIKWFTNDSPSGSVSVNGPAGVRLPIERRSASTVLPGPSGGDRAAGQEPGARRHRPRVDGDPRHGRGGRRDRHPPDVRQAQRLRGQQLHRRRGRRAVGLCHLGAWEPAAFSVDLSFRLLFMVIIGGLGSIMGSFFGAAFIVVLPIFLNQLLPAGWASAYRSPRRRPRTGAHDLRRADRLVPDRRAAWPGAAVVHRQAEAAPLALPALIFCSQLPMRFRFVRNRFFSNMWMCFFRCPFKETT
jgi:hypothetical protein